MRENDIDILISRPFKLVESSLDKIKISLAEEINCRVEEIHEYFDRDKGYYFYGPYDVCVADLLFEGSQYRGIQIYGGIIAELKVQLEEERRRLEEEQRSRDIRERKENQYKLEESKKKRRRKYITQKYVIPGVMITALGISALASIGAIHKAVTPEPVEVEQQADINTVANANDLILFAWANYAMEELSCVAQEMGNENVKSLAEDIRLEFFTPIMSSYYSYVEESMLDLPLELTSESIKTNHNSFRNNVYLFDEELKRIGFGDYSFTNSPFANAIVIDLSGQILDETDDLLFGEVCDSNGTLITVDNEGDYILYVRAQDIIGNDYGYSNYPLDAIMYQGVAYVSSSHLRDYGDPGFGTK